MAAAALTVTTAAAAPAPGAKKQQAKQEHKVRPSKLDIKLEEQARKTTGESDVIIEFTNDKDALKVIKGFGQAHRKLGILKAYSATVPNRLLAQLAAQGLVKKVSLDRDVRLLNGRTAITTGARAAQELSGYTGAGVGVAVVDSGVVGYHDDLTYETQGYTMQQVTTLQWNGFLWLPVVSYVQVPTTTYSGQRVTHFKDFVGTQTSAYDDFGHGTHVAGTIAGNGHASAGQRRSIAPAANIIALKALDGQGHSTISTIIAAIDYAVAVKNTYNIRVLNLSLGAGVYESYDTDPLTLAAKRAVEAGIVVVAAAGNLGRNANGDPQYGAITAPANAPWVLSVGASSTEGTTDRTDDAMGGYSSRGPTMIDYVAKPDLVAPGTGTVSASAPGSLLYTSLPQLLLPGLIQTSDGLLQPTATLPYMSLSGTSMSAPVVTGTVALMLQANPNLTPNLVKAILQYTAEVYPGYDWLTQGAGFLNARAAVQLSEYFATAASGTPYPDVTGWSRHIFWGNYRVTGGVLTSDGTAWGSNVVWGELQTPEGGQVVWGNCVDANNDGQCDDNVVWGNNCVDDNGDGQCDNVVWSNCVDANNDGQCDNVVWGNCVDANNDGQCDDNVVWGNDCQGADCDNVVWGNCVDENNDGVCDNVVWGNCVDENGDGICDNVVWGNCEDADGDGQCDNVVWGNCEDADGDGQCDNVVWGNCVDENNDGQCDDNVVWGNCVDENNDGQCDNVVWGNAFEEVVFGDEGADVSSFNAEIWDDLFRVTVLLRSNLVSQ